MGGASDAQFKGWGLARNNYYKITGPNKPTSLDNKSFSMTNSAFTALGFSEAQLKDVWSIVAGVILLVYIVKLYVI